MRDVVDQVITSNRAASGFKTQQQAESGGGGGGGMTSGSPTIARTNSLGGRRMPAGVNETISAGPSASLRLRLIHFIHWLVCLPVSVYLSVCLAACGWLTHCCHRIVFSALSETDARPISSRALSSPARSALSSARAPAPAPAAVSLSQGLLG